VTIGAGAISVPGHFVIENDETGPEALN